MGIQFQEQPESDMHSIIINIFMMLPYVIYLRNYDSTMHLNYTETNANLYSEIH